MLPENEVTEYESRLYVNPETSMNEQLGFIDNLRAVQQANNQAINTDLENLGTYPAAQSNLGGLLGGSGYFTSRYQVPQSVAMYNDLTAAARASALNQALKNEQEKWNQRYRRARSANYRRSAGGSGGGGGTGDDTTRGGLDLLPTNKGKKVNPDDITATTAPREGLSDTTVYQQGVGWVTTYSDGSKYVDGKKVRGSYAEQNAQLRQQAARNVATQLAMMTPAQRQLALSRGGETIRNYVMTYGKTGGGW